MGFFKIINKGKGLKRLFMGGVHGKEGLTTIKALKVYQRRMYRTVVWLSTIVMKANI